MTAEHSSEEDGEGLRLTEAERETLADYTIRAEVRNVRAAVERILAQRLAAVQAAGLRDVKRWFDKAVTEQARTLAAEAERDDLRGRLAAVESAVEQIESLAKVQAISCQAQHRADHARNWLDVLALTERAALANPSAAQGEGEA